MIKNRAKKGLLSLLLALLIVASAPLGALAQVKTSDTAEEESNIRQTKKSTKIYKKKNVESDVIGRIPKGATVALISSSGSWSKVSYDGITGFIKKNCLKKFDSESDEDSGEKIDIVRHAIDIEKLKDPHYNGETVDDVDDSGLTELDKSKNRVSNWAKYLVIGEGGMAIPQLFQFDYTQKVCIYNGTPRSVATSGCGVTSLSMAIAYLTGNTEQSPYSLFREACQDGMYKGSGLGHNALVELARRYGITGEWKSMKESELKKTLKDGVPVIAHMGSGFFTEKGHYIVLRGVTDDGMILVNDPASKKNSMMAYPAEIFIKERRIGQSFMVMTKNDEILKPDATKIIIMPSVAAEGGENDARETVQIEGVVETPADTDV